MFQSFVITLREGVEAALIIGIVLGHLRKTGRAAWAGIVYWGLAAALLASLAGAYVLSRMEVNQEALEGWLMLAGALFVASMALWMWRTGKHLKREIEAKLTQLAAAPSRAAAVGLFTFVFLMVFREGVETVLFLGAVSLRTSDLLNFVGGVLGLAVAIGLGVAFFKGSLKVDLRKFFAVTTLVLLVIAAQLLVSGIHELSEAQILPSGPREMALIGPIVNNDAFFFVMVVALSVFLISAQRLQDGKPAADPSALTAPERRKLLAQQRRERFWKMAGLVVGLLTILSISADFVYSRSAQSLSPAQPVSLEAGEVRISVSQLADRKLHRFVAEAGGASVRFIAILDGSDTVRAGLDACLICGTQGYYQDGPNVICRHCAAAIYVPTIGMAGGCNPIHIDYRVEGETLIISEAALADAAKYFQ
jgi:high-affinity iron transporter